MKNITFLALAIFLFASCSKDASLITVEGEVAALSNVNVSAIMTGSNVTEAGHACEPNLIVNTTVGLFYEKEGITGDTNMSNADYTLVSGTGSAYFHNIKPGKYSILAINEMGSKVKTRMMDAGSNDVVIEF